MSLPVAGGGGFGPRGPARPPTHAPADMRVLMNLAMDLDDIAVDDELSPDALEEFAEERGVPRAMVYAAVALAPHLPIARRHDIAFSCCVAGCQQWGALDRIEHLLRARDRRTEASQPAFDVLVRGCMDRCDQAPVVVVHTPDGVAAVPAEDNANLDAALAELFGETP